MKNYLVLSLLIIISLFVFTGPRTTVLSQGQEVCPQTSPWTSHFNVNDLTYTYNAPSGFLISDSCYKASTTLVFQTYNPAVTSVDLNSNVWNNDNCSLGENGCNYQDISHASFKLVAVDPTPTPTATPSDDPTPTPTATPSDDPTPTPTATATATSSSTSTPEPSNDSGIGGGEVLGTSTMAATGGAMDAIFYSMFTFGSLLTSFGIMKNGKKAKI